MRFSSLVVMSGVLFGAIVSGCSGGGSPATPLSFTTSSLAGGTVNKAYSATVSASGGTAPFTYTLSAGSTLPAGLTLAASTGVIAGTPTAAGVSKFTIGVTDSESTPASASASFTMTVTSATPLAITSGAPPSGTVQTSYSFTFAATGGVPPYTWATSSGTLPAGLTLSSAGVVSGTPTTAGSSTFDIQVTDSANSVVTTSSGITITAAGIALPQATYSFNFRGFGPQGGVALAGLFELAANQTVVIGFFDENTTTGPPQSNGTIPLGGGSIAVGSNGLGQLKLSLGTGSVTFQVAVPTNIGTAGVDSSIRIIEFDDSTGKGTRGSGTMKFYSGGTPAASALKGSYAFGLSGLDSAQNHTGVAGSIQMDGSGNITAGEATANDNGTMSNISAITGTYAISSLRGTMQLMLNGTPYNFAFYPVAPEGTSSPTQLFLIETDPVSSTLPLITGSMLPQAGPFTTASLKGVDVLELTGLFSANSTPVSDNTLGLLTADGGGKLSISYDENKNGLITPLQTYSGTYAVDGSGKVTITASGTPPVLYLVSASEAFVVGTDTSASFGIVESQSGTPFSNTSFNGTYLGGSVSPTAASVVNQVSQLVATGATGALTINYDSSGPTGLLDNNTVAATFAADGTGGIVVTESGSTAMVFYVVSPTKVVSITTGADGWLGSYEQ